MTFKKTRARLEGCARAAAIAGGCGMLAVSAMITADVLARKFLHVTIGGANEIAGYAFAASTALSYPFVLFDRANIRIDALYSLIPTKPRAVLDLLAIALTALFVTVLANSIFGVFAKSFEGGATTIGVINIPRWIPQAPWMLGFVFFALTAVFLTICAGVALARRDWAGVNRIAGVPSLAETIDEETHDVAPIAGVDADRKDPR